MLRIFIVHVIAIIIGIQLQLEYVRVTAFDISSLSPTNFASRRYHSFKMMSTSTNEKKFSVAILGASGYTGAELVRLLSYHPHVSISVLTADRSAGQEFKNIYPQYAYRTDLPKLTNWEESKAHIQQSDVAFCCLPHGTTQEIISILSLEPKLKIIDLSADFRLRDINAYETWYGKPHAAPSLQKESIYGLPEINRRDIKNCRLIANPGCYPTAAQLPLVPLLKAKLIQTEDIIIDAKSGVTGAGRAPKESSLYCEVADGIHAYGVASHRHSPEIEQGLMDASETENLIINFTPHLMPMSRGILETIYVKMSPGVTVEDLKVRLQQQYKDEPFVHILDGKNIPQTRHVRGTNLCFINVIEDRIKGRAVIISVIDNVVKGASGQAIQNMNIMLDLPETTGLNHAPMFP